MLILLRKGSPPDIEEVTQFFPSSLILVDV